MYYNNRLDRLQFEKSIKRSKSYQDNNQQFQQTNKQRIQNFSTTIAIICATLQNLTTKHKKIALYTLLDPNIGQLTGF